MRARIFVFAFHRAQSLEISGLCDVLTEANLQTGLALYDVDVVADEEPIICESGLRILPDGTIPDHRYDKLDTLVVVGPRGVAALTLSPPTATWLSEHALSAR